MEYQETIIRGGDKLENQSSYDPKDFFELGATFNNSFNLSTGNDKNQTYFSIAAVNSDGIVPNNKYHRYNVTLRNTAKFLNDKLTLDASASYIREYYNNMISYGTYFNQLLAHTYIRAVKILRKRSILNAIIVNSDILNSNGVPEILVWIYKTHIGLPIVIFVRK